MTNLVVQKNRDRYTKCCSCRATADFLITNPDATITRIRPRAEPTGEWVGDQPVYRDEVKATAATVSTCRRHAELNSGRIAKAESQTFVFDGQRWNEE